MDNRQFSRALSFIDSWLEYRSRYVVMPGFVVGIARAGLIEYIRGFGRANIEEREPMRTHHLFRVASHSKVYTATAVMKLVAAGKLGLDDPLVRHLPWLRRHRSRDMNAITARHVLSHSAGILRDGLEADHWQLASPFPDAQALKSTLLQSPLVFEPNVQMKYSNIGFSLLGLLVETVSKRSFSAFVEEDILKPGKLKNTCPDLPRPPSMKDGQFVTGYSRPDFDGGRLPFPPLATNAMAPAAGFCANAADLLSFFSSHIVGSSRPLLPEALKREMQRKQWEVPESAGKKHYGLGFMLLGCGKRTLVGHSGGFPGQRTRTFFDPCTKLCVTVLTNAVDAEVEAMLEGIFSVFDFFSARTSAVIDKEMRQLEGRYHDLWGPIQVVALSSRSLALANPHSWSPFESVEDLEKTGRYLFRCTRAEGFSAPGESLRFYLRNGKVVRAVQPGGQTMYPEDLYKRQAKKVLLTCSHERR